MTHRHPDHACQLSQSDFFLIMEIDIFLHLLYPAAIGMNINLGKEELDSVRASSSKRESSYRIVINLITA